MSTDCPACEAGVMHVHSSGKYLMKAIPPAHQHAWKRVRLLRPDEPIVPGLIVVTKLGEIDDDDGIERFTLPGSVGVIKARNHGPVWDLVFEHNGAWVCPDERELRDPEQYTLYVKD